MNEENKEKEVEEKEEAKVENKPEITKGKNKFVEKYLEIYFDEMLIKDINIIKSKTIEDSSFNFTLPYILLVCTGIDFLGGLTEGFRSDNPGERSCNFIKKWMGRINGLYEVKGMSDIIWNSVRCGAIDQTIYKKGIESSSETYLYAKHLWLKIRPESGNRIFIHALQFVDDFKKAQNLYRKEYINQNIDKVYENLKCMLSKEKIKKFNYLENYLIKNKYTFEDEDDLIRKKRHSKKTT